VQIPIPAGQDPDYFATYLKWSLVMELSPDKIQQNQEQKQKRSQSIFFVNK